MVNMRDIAASAMTVSRVVRPRDGVVICERLYIASSWLQRLRGLLFYRPLRQSEGLWITPCRSIHTLGMRYALDVLFIDRNGCVRAVHTNVKSGRARSGPRMPLDTLELPAGRAESLALRVGDELAVACDTATRRATEDAGCSTAAEEDARHTRVDRFGGGR